MGRRRDLKPLSAAIESLTRDLQPQSQIARLQSVWPEAVGETVAGWATPDSLSGDTATFKCIDSVVAHELEMMKSQLLEKLASKLGEGAPKELRFVIR